MILEAMITHNVGMQLEAKKY